MYCGAIARVIGLRVCAIVHNGLCMESSGISTLKLSDVNKAI